MKDEYERMVYEILGLPGDPEMTYKSASDCLVVGLMLCKRLDKIANSLDKLYNCLREGGENA